jgi:hypothetical protein
VAAFERTRLADAASHPETLRAEVDEAQAVANGRDT